MATHDAVGAGIDIAANISHPILNPNTPYAYIPEVLAWQALFTNYVTVCCLAVLIWDILNNLHGDYTIVFRRRFGVPTVGYVVARLASLGYMIGKTIGLTKELNDCERTEQILCAFYALSHASTAFLMFLRVCAVYNWKPLVTLFFTLSWIIATGGAVATVFSVQGVHIPPTRYCTTIIKKDAAETLIQLPTWADIFNDTAIFAAIMYRLSTSESGGTRSWRTGVLVRRPASRFHRFTNAFLEDTQVYYLVTVILNWTTLIVYFSIRDPPGTPFRIIMGFPNTIIVNIMACRVFRNLKLGRLGSFFGSGGRRSGSSGKNGNLGGGGGNGGTETSMVIPGLSVTDQSNIRFAEMPGTTTQVQRLSLGHGFGESLNGDRGATGRYEYEGETAGKTDAEADISLENFGVESTNRTGVARIDELRTAYLNRQRSIKEVDLKVLHRTNSSKSFE